MRNDLLTHHPYPKDELLRLFVREGQLFLDPTQQAGGRGLYVHKDPLTVDKVIAKNLLRRYSSKTDFGKLGEEMKALCLPQR
jgi:predicted RNA-binding protein YlxR (DUF448 family)